MPTPRRYEWDPDKRLRNADKHRLDFEDAWRVLESPVCWDLPSWRVEGEQRRVAIAFVPEVPAVLVLVYVVRDSAVRCISFRHASRGERETYREYLQEVGHRDE
ncbi:MAG: BrnT family toxin [Coriobacteriia bacterium]